MATPTSMPQAITVCTTPSAPPLVLNLKASTAPRIPLASTEIFPDTIATRTGQQAATMATPTFRLRKIHTTHRLTRFMSHLTIGAMPPLLSSASRHWKNTTYRYLSNINHYIWYFLYFESHFPLDKRDEPSSSIGSDPSVTRVGYSNLRAAQPWTSNLKPNICKR